jgi:hypothetical protein
MANNLEYTLRLKDLFSKSMKAALVETKNMDNQMSSLKSTIQSLTVGLGGLALGKQILDVGVQFDSIKAGLETLTGSAENAVIVFEQIKKDAASTPFDVGSLATANQMLIGAGANAQEARNNVLNKRISELEEANYRLKSDVESTNSNALSKSFAS